MESQGRALVHRLIDEVINGQRLELLEELFSPELVPPVQHAFAAFRTAFPDWREEMVELVAEENYLAVRFRCSGTFRGEFMGFAPNGRHMDVDEVFFLRVHDGRFVSYWGLEDNLARLQQLG
ncbi:MAG: ester cyclase, partial [Solirubrobacteraceae bacterium]